jgi:acyl-CoA synthetase (AMP-forming)/AMP-acid ligase II
MSAASPASVPEIVERVAPAGSGAGLGGASWAEAITVGDALLRTAAATPDALALVTPEGRWSYRELADRAAEVARSLIGLGVEPGDHVGVLIPNSFECLTALFGVALAGAAVVPINARYRSVELGVITRDADLVAIVTSDMSDEYVDYLALLREALPGLEDARDPYALSIPSAPRLRSIVMLGERRAEGILDPAAFDQAGAGVSSGELDERRSQVGLRHPWMVLYTSGTTARPRGCLISHEGEVRTWGAVAGALRLRSGDRVWNPCPMFHVAAIGVSISCVLSGATNVTARFFEPASSIELITEQRPTVLYPAYANIILDVLNHPDAAALDLGDATRMLVVGPPRTLRDVQERLPGTTLVSTFGMTETSGCSTAHDLDDDLAVRTETVGLPLPGLQARIVDPESLQELPRGTPGEIQLRGPLLCDGYYNDPEKTAAAFLPDGWLRTGDHGSMDESGRLAFLGRIRDIVRVGGENVSPAEVEAHLMTHPAVHLAVVVGVPDERLDEVPAAFVELRPGASASEEELIAHCRGRIASFKVPRHVRFVTTWPMSATKILKSELKDRLVEELAAS